MAQSVVTWQRDARRTRRLVPAFLGVSLVGVFFWLRFSTPVSWLVFVAVSAAVGIVAAFVAYAFRARFFCPGCNKHIPAGMEWVCGYCDSPNGGMLNTFLSACRTCGRVPAVLICPHPHRADGGGVEMYPIKLAETTESVAHPARKLTPQQPGESIEQAKARWVRERQLIEAEMLSAGAVAKSTLARSKREDTVAENDLQRAFRLQDEAGGAVLRAEQQAKQIQDTVAKEIDQLKALATNIPQVIASTEDGCRAIDAIPGLPEDVRETAKLFLRAKAEAAMNRLSEF